MSKNRKKNRMNRPPQQSRAVKKMPKKSDDREKITEADALKFRISKLKDMGLADRQELLKKDKKILELNQEILKAQEENLLLRQRLVAFENQRDLGHLDLQDGDQLLTEDDGNFYIKRAKGSAIPKIPRPPEPEPEEEEEEEDEGEEEPEEQEPEEAPKEETQDEGSEPKGK